MKKLLGIVVLSLLLSGNVMAKTKNIGNGLSISIPDNYKYFEITFKQLVLRFPNITSNEQVYDDFGIGIDAKLIVIANKQKTIKFFDDVTSISGLEKLNRKHLQPILKKMEDPKFLEVIMKDLQKFAPNADFETMSEEEVMELVERALENPKIVKKYDRIAKPYYRKFLREYIFEKYTILLVGDKKAKILDELKDKDIDDLVKIVKDGLIEIYEESKDPSLKKLKNWEFEIAKNNQGNLYLYSNDTMDSPIIKKKLYNEIFLTSHSDKILIAFSTCSKKCNGSTDFLNIIKPTNLYVESNFNLEANDSNNLSEQLKAINELYKLGALTKEEFTKAKKKLLN
jgi:hypothetical protein